MLLFKYRMNFYCLLFVYLKEKKHVAGFDISVFKLEEKKATSRSGAPPHLRSVSLRCRAQNRLGLPRGSSELWLSGSVQGSVGRAGQELRRGSVPVAVSAGASARAGDQLKLLLTLQRGRAIPSPSPGHGGHAVPVVVQLLVPRWVCPRLESGEMKGCVAPGKAPADDRYGDEVWRLLLCFIIFPPYFAVRCAGGSVCPRSGRRPAEPAAARP